MTDPLVVIKPGRGIDQTISARLAWLLPVLRVWIRRELRSRYRQSVLRAGWSLVQPVTILATYGLILTRVLDVGSEGAPYLAFAWAGIVPFTFAQQSLGQGVGSIQQAGSLISRVYFPREVLPLAVIGAALVDLTVMTGLLVAVSWVQVGPPSIHLLGLLPIFGMLVLWVTGLTVLTAALTVFRRDLSHAMPLALRVLFIVSPVMYPVSLLGVAGQLNPLAVVIDGVRGAAYGRSWPDPAVLAAHTLGGLVLVLLAFAVHRRLEGRMGDYV